MQYGQYTITYDPKPIPLRGYDYDFVHLDYCGEGDPRSGNGKSYDDCKAQIDSLDHADTVENWELAN